MICLATSAWDAWRFSLADPFRPDFSVYWTAARIALESPGRLYDFEFVTGAQSWLASPQLGPRPWVYPPSALPFFLPFALLPFWASYLVWGAATLACFWAASRMFVRGWGLILAMMSPPIVWAMVPGQTSLLTGAGILAGLGLERHRPFLGGVLIGLVAAIKPQLVILAPVILWRGKRALAGFLVGGGSLVAVSLMFGIGRWLEWVAIFPEFAHAVDQLGIMTRGVTPLSAAAVLGLGGFGAWSFQIGGWVAGLALAFWAANKDSETRVIGLVCGGLLVSPYAMMRELAPLMPIAAAALLSGRQAGLLKGLPLMGIGGAFTMPAMAVGALLDQKSKDAMAGAKARASGAD